MNRTVAVITGIKGCRKCEDLYPTVEAALPTIKKFIEEGERPQIVNAFDLINELLRREDDEVNREQALGSVAPPPFVICRSSSPLEK